MTKKSKREERIRANKRNVSLEDFEALIRQYGEIETGGSHPKARLGNRIFPYRRTNPIKPPYVEKIIEIIDDLVEKGLVEEAGNDQSD